MSILDSVDSDFCDTVLAEAPEYIRDRQDADLAIAASQLGRPLDDVLGSEESDAT